MNKERSQVVLGADRLIPTYPHFTGRYYCSSEDEMIQLGCHLGSQLLVNSVLCFFGELGAGKTTLIKGIVRGAIQCSEGEVRSPTFNYLNIYSGNLTLYHFDLYRLPSSEEFLNMGFDEVLFAGGISCIEWSEKISTLLPPNCLQILIEYVAGVSARSVTIR